MHTLLAHLGLLCINRIAMADNPEYEFLGATEPTPRQQRVFELLDVDPAKMFPVHALVE